MIDANPIAMPMDPHANLFEYELNDDIRTAMRSRLYAHLIGSLMYAAISTRPDIAFSVSALSQFIPDPAPIHWEAAKRALRYLKGTRDLALTFGASDDSLIGYTDADWASQAHRRSFAGTVFLFAGGAISWSSRKQPIVALSSTKAEYVAASDSSRELIWLCSLLGKLTTPLSSHTPLCCNNKSATSLTKNGPFSAWTKHIDIRYISFVELSSTASSTSCIVPRTRY